MELTNEEKISILNQHIKNIVVNKYNLHVSILAEEAADPIDQIKIDALNNQIDAEQAKYDALLVEYNSLQVS
jgi:hypothetical protein